CPPLLPLLSGCTCLFSRRTGGWRSGVVPPPLSYSSSSSIRPLSRVMVLKTRSSPGPAGLTRTESVTSTPGGQVYPGEATRVPVSDHSLHLSKAKISKPAPYWEGTAVINGEFKELKLTDYKGKYLVFFFYPLDFTFVCPTEIIAFGDRIEEFRSINTEVVACSVDSQFTHLAWINTPRKQGGLGPMKIPLLSDLTHQISKDYGVYLEDQGHTLRGLFIIDDKGVLRQITMNDLPVGRSVDETLRLVQAFQYTDKHGEVCPAGWKPGSETVSIHVYPFWCP
ncbi:unnamed protein product, partial [Staurois parvus]